MPSERNMMVLIGGNDTTKVQLMIRYAVAFWQALTHSKRNLLYKTVYISTLICGNSKEDILQWSAKNWLYDFSTDDRVQVTVYLNV